MPYHPLSIVLHWLTVAGLAAATAMAVIMVDIPGITPQKLRLFNYHKWMGVCLWGLVLVRLAVRLLRPPVPLPAALPRWQVVTAKGLHVALYGLLLTVPLLGYLYSLAAGFPVVLFGVWPLPVVMQPDPALKPVLKAWHLLANQALWALVCLHVAAALKHALIDRDGVFERMWPRLRSGGES